MTKKKSDSQASAKAIAVSRRLKVEIPQRLRHSVSPFAAAASKRAQLDAMESVEETLAGLQAAENRSVKRKPAVNKKALIADIRELAATSTHPAFDALGDGYKDVCALVDGYCNEEKGDWPLVSMSGKEQQLVFLLVAEAES